MLPKTLSKALSSALEFYNKLTDLFPEGFVRSKDEPEVDIGSKRGFTELRI